MKLEDLLNKIEHQLTLGIDEPSVNQVLAQETRAFMGANPESRSKLGPLLGRLKSLPKQNTDIDLNWVDVLNGSIALGHRPKLKMLKDMQRLGTTHVLTLLSEKEGAKDIGKETKKQGLEWLWLSLHSAEPPGQDRLEEILNTFKTCVNELESGAKIYIHCSAGIHRTGMIAYALFRYIGFDVDKSETLLSRLRDVTSKEVGDHRKSWAEELLTW